jgi:molybdopterin adenylyltransferase
MTESPPAKIGIVTVSDRASKGLYQDEGGPAIAAYLAEILASKWQAVARIIPDGFESVRDTLVDLCDKERCDLILTTGGTGPSPRDVTTEATQAVIVKELPGFGELMRAKSLEQVPTAILSRQTAGTRGTSLIVNLPGKPGSIRLCLSAVFPAIPYCLDLIGAARLETDPAKCAAFRPKG